MRHNYYDPDILRALFNYPGDLDHLSDHPAKSHIKDRKAMATTAVDVKETSGSYLFVADMPGLSRSDIQVYVLAADVRESPRSVVLYMMLSRRDVDSDILVSNVILGANRG